jgi:hypothetical protein
MKSFYQEEPHVPLYMSTVFLIATCLSGIDEGDYCPMSHQRQVEIKRVKTLRGFGSTPKSECQASDLL